MESPFGETPFGPAEENVLRPTFGEAGDTTLLTDAEYEKLMEAALRGFSATGKKREVTDAEVERFIRWCEAQIIGTSLIQLVLKGLLAVDVEDEEPRFRALFQTIPGIEKN
jgi:hypothetical protein